MSLAGLAALISSLALAALIYREWMAWRASRQAHLQLMQERDRDGAVRELLFLSAIEGMRCLTRGGKGCVFRAVELLRPDIAKHWADEDGDDGSTTLRKFFPAPEDLS